MLDLTGVKLQYFSPAYPPKNIHLTWTYELGFDEYGSYVFDGNLKTHIDYDILKMLFRPVNYHNWYEIDSFLFPKNNEIKKENYNKKNRKNKRG